MDNTLPLPASRLLDKDYIQGLSGWKCIAIMLLITDHLYLASGAARPAWAIAFTDGLTGVFALFVISGYLVTRSALKEKKASGVINVKRFFLRRALRVIPAYYVFLLAMGLFGKNVPWSSVIAGLTYTINYTSRPPIIIDVGHLWACCVEEHFYLLWIPWLAAVKSKRSWLFIAAVIILSTGLRCLSLPYMRDPAMWWYEVNNWFYKYSASHLHFHAVALGAGLALFEGHPRFERIMLVARRCQAHLWALLFIVVLSPWLSNRYGLVYFWDFKPLLTPFALTVLLGVYLRCEENRLTHFLGNPVIGSAGLLYYSMYLWQQPFTFSFFSADPHTARAIESVCLALLCAITSFFLIETPFSRLRRKI